MYIHLGGSFDCDFTHMWSVVASATRVDYWLHFDGWTVQWCIVNPKLGLGPNFCLGCHQDIVGNHQAREGSPLAMMLVGILKYGLHVHIHLRFSAHWQFGLLGRKTQRMPTSFVSTLFLVLHFDPTPFNVVFHYCATFPQNHELDLWLM